MDPREVPPELRGLTQVEEMRIAMAATIMRVCRLKGGQEGYGGHVANVAQDVGDLVQRLPRLSTDVPVLVVHRDGGNDGTHKDFLARRQRVLDTLLWLQLNNRSLYTNTNVHKLTTVAISILLVL